MILKPAVARFLKESIEEKITFTKCSHRHREMQQCRLVKVEVDEGENMKLAGHYRLRGFPTIMLFEKGEEKGRFSGSRATHWIDEWLDEHLAG